MKTQTQTLYLSVFTVLLLSAIVATPANGASAQATVSVKVVRHVSITNKSNMSFGHLSVGAAAGSVVLNEDGSRNPTGGVVLETGGFSTPASFTASGEPNQSFAVTLPDSITLVDDAGNTMLVEQFSNTTGKTGTFDEAGSHELNVGGTLRVNSHQSLGDYHGSMDISINYN